MQVKSKMVTVLFMLLFLSGCVGELDRARSEFVCKDLGGVYKYGLGTVEAICNNGSTHSLPKTVPEEFWVNGEEGSK